MLGSCTTRRLSAQHKKLCKGFISLEFTQFARLLYGIADAISPLTWIQTSQIAKFYGRKACLPAGRHSSRTRCLALCIFKGTMAARQKRSPTQNSPSALSLFFGKIGSGPILRFHPFNCCHHIGLMVRYLLNSRIYYQYYDV